MFTGIVDHVCAILSCERSAGERVSSMMLWIDSLFKKLTLGESIAIDGVCLSVVASKSGQFACELSAETLTRAVAASYKVGQRVNVERALRLSDRMGGHLVTGHVDTTLQVQQAQSIDGRFVRLVLTGISPSDQCHLIPKGSITVNGVSLTINRVLDEGDGVELMLIPHTLEYTNLGALRAGDAVNVEYDQVVKIIAKQAAQYFQHSILRHEEKVI